MSFDEFWKEYSQFANTKFKFWDCFQFEAYKKTMDYVVNKNKNDYDIYIGRPSVWGNPFYMKKEWQRPWVVEQYKQWVLFPEEDKKDIGGLTVSNTEVRERVRELKGKKLGCFCFPKLCHGNILAFLANCEMDLFEKIFLKYGL